jgi:hypothetical protein
VFLSGEGLGQTDRPLISVWKMYPVEFVDVEECQGIVFVASDELLGVAQLGTVAGNCDPALVRDVVVPDVDEFADMNRQASFFLDFPPNGVFRSGVLVLCSSA